MARTKGTGLLMVWCEVPQDKEEEFNRWYNEEHLAERLAVPGLLSAARYEAVSSGPKHLAVYELESPAVMESPEYLEVRRAPTEWSKRMSPEFIGTVYIRNVYEQVHPSAVSDETAESPMAPVLQIGTNGHSSRHGVGVEPLVQHGVCAQLREGTRGHPGQAVGGRRGGAEVPHDVRVRARSGLPERGVSLSADGPSRQRAYAGRDGARRRFSGHLGEDFRARVTLSSLTRTTRTTSYADRGGYLT